MCFFGLHTKLEDSQRFLVAFLSLVFAYRVAPLVRWDVAFGFVRQRCVLAVNAFTVEACEVVGGVVAVLFALVETCPVVALFVVAVVVVAFDVVTGFV